MLSTASACWIVLALLAITAKVSAPQACLSVSQGQSKAVPRIYSMEYWTDLRDKTLCDIQVTANEQLGVQEVWCKADNLQVNFVKDDKMYACRPMRHTIPFLDSDVDIAAGCVLRSIPVVKTEAIRLTPD